MRISVVIPAIDEATQIRDAIGSAARRDVEVIVVDGGSRDDTVALAQAAGARVLRSPAGRARQLERGFRAATGDAVLFLHADTRLPDGYDDAVCGALRERDCVGGAFAFRFDRSSAWLRLIERGVWLRVRLFGLAYGDQAIFARRSVLASLGGVPQAEIMEDLDLVRALRLRGHFAPLSLPVATSARRYAARGVLRTLLRNQLASLCWALGVDRARVAAWYRR